MATPVSHTSGNTNGEMPLQHLAVVTRATGHPESRRYEALLLPNDNGWNLPRPVFQDAGIRSAPPVNKAMAEQFGLETSLLRCLFQREGSDSKGFIRAYAVELHGLGDEIPKGAMWAEPQQLADLALSHVDDRMALNAWVEGVTSSPELGAAWYAAGWWDPAIVWIDEALAVQSVVRTGPSRQVRSWALSSIIRTPTSTGDVYFKAVPPFMAQEGVAMDAIAREYPAMVSAPLASDKDRGWLLMPDFGGKLLVDVPDIERWEEAVRRHAIMQVEQAERTGLWLQMGMPDRSIRRMVDLIDPLITVSSRMLAGRAQGLSDEEVQALQGLSMRLKFMCAQLADFGIPHSLVHGDLGGNILAKDDGDFVFFDWTDACISHPFFDMATMANTVFDDNHFQGNESVGDRLRDAYLEPWAKHEPMDRLVQAYDAAKPLGALHQAMSYMWILNNIAEDARWEVEVGLPTWIRTLLRLCGQL